MTITSGKNGHVRIEYDPDQFESWSPTPEQVAEWDRENAKLLGYDSVEDYKAALRKADAYWCKCGNPSKQTTYYDDYEGELCDKHHYTCDDCNLIFQVG